MKDGAVIINCARGELFNDDDVIEAVKSGKLSRIVTDLPNAKLIGIENVITFPHLGASTPEAEDNCAVMAANELKEYIENGNVINSVNFPNLKVTKQANRITVLASSETSVSYIEDLVKSNNINVSAVNSSSRGNLTYVIIDTKDSIDNSLIDLLNSKFIKARAL